MTTFLHSRQIRGIIEVNQTQTLSLRSSESSKGDKNEEKNIRRQNPGVTKGVSVKSPGVPVRDKGEVGSRRWWGGF